MPVDSAGPSAIANFNTGLAVDLVDCKTTLTPSLVGHSAVNLTACGVNLFQTTATSKSEAGVDWIVNADGTISVSGVANGYTSLEVGTAKVNNRMGVVTISGIASATNIAWNVVELRDADNNTLYTVANGGLYASFTIDLTSYPDVDNIRISLKRNNNSAVSGVIKPQVEFGNEVTTYHAYTGNSYAIALGDTYYGGVLDVTRGVLTVEYDISLQPITPYDVQLTPTAVTARSGVNNVYSDTGDTSVKFKDSIQHYIDTH